ncbi:MAG: chromate transporter [Bacillota bacterium]|nr:chromate transporter [Bacillota bacterium]
MKDLLTLFTVFFRISLFTFGGGYTMLPLLEKEICEDLNWADKSEIIDYFAVSQCVPGVIAINVASFIGYKRKGLAGAVAAAVGVASPAFIAIVLIAALFTNFSDNAVVRHAFSGIRVAVCALLAKAVADFYKAGVRDLFGLFLFLASLVLSVFFSVSPVIPVLAAGLAGVLYKTVRRANK